MRNRSHLLEIRHLNGANKNQNRKQFLLKEKKELWKQQIFKILELKIGFPYSPLNMLLQKIF